MSTEPIPVEKLARQDIRRMVSTMSLPEARYCVDLYYQVQEFRKASGNQIKAAVKAAESCEFLGKSFADLERVELNIKIALDEYTKLSPVSRWAKSVTGVGPVIAAGLAAHIDVKKAPTAGHIWRFAGLDPTVSWNKGEKRPWNASLKTLCWKIGESFVKTSGLESDFYGHFWAERKSREWERNRRGELANQAKAALAAKEFKEDTETKIWLEGRLTLANLETWERTDQDKRLGLVKKLAGAPGSGIPMLSPAHIHARARRWAVKLFLAHWQYVAFVTEHGCPPPKPYVIEHLGHAHEIQVPNCPTI